MKRKNLLYLLIWSILFTVFTSCGDKEDLPIPEPTPDPTPGKTYVDGFNFEPKIIEADKPLTITFKAPAGTSLHGISGDLYLYSGLGGAWKGAPSSWTDNQDCYKMSSVSESPNTWSITLPESVSKFYKSSQTNPSEMLNIIVRSADGQNQTSDCTFPVMSGSADFTFVSTQEQAVPISNENPEGIHVNSASSVTLVMYDNATDGTHKSHAYVIGSFNDWKLEDRYQMKYDPAKHCWWITLESLPAGGFTFQYYVYSSTDGGSVMCDPYSEQVLEKDVDNSFPLGAYGKYVTYVQTSTADYNWQINNFKIKNAESLVIYEMLLRDFTEMHNLEGAKQKIEYLKDLGINAIELMPVQEFDGNNSWGYNTSFYFALDNSYGTQKEYKQFIDECHKSGIAVLLDVVYNHTNNNNPFAKLYWDVFSNQPSPKNPWLNVDTPHKKYVFSPDDFNHQSEQTRRFVNRNLKYLLETYRIDGFRFDFTKGFTQRRTTSDNDLSAYDADRVAVLKEYAAHVRSVKKEAIVIMEHFCNTEEQELAPEGICFWRNMNNAYAQAAMGWNEESDFRNLYDTRYPLQFVGYMESHDEERLSYKQTQWGNGYLKTNLASRMQQLATDAAFFILVPGPKMIWQFGELGYDYSINSNSSGNLISEEYRTAPKPLRWDYLQQPDRKQLHTVYKSLLDLRNTYPLLFHSPASFDWQVKTSDWNKGRTLYLKASSGEELVVLGNFTNQSRPVAFPSTSGEWINVLTNTNEQVGLNVEIEPNACKVFLRK